MQKTTAHEMHPSDPRRPTRRKVKALAEKGWEARAIALELGVSVQRVSKILVELRAAGELPPREAAS